MKFAGQIAILRINASDLKPPWGFLQVHPQDKLYTFSKAVRLPNFMGK